MTDADKTWIDNASYQQMLSRWRFAPLGDTMFQGDTGDYFQKVQSQKYTTPEAHTAASKQIGW